MTAHASSPNPNTPNPPAPAVPDRRVLVVWSVRTVFGFLLVLAVVVAVLWGWSRPLTSDSSVAGRTHTVTAPVSGCVMEVPEIGAFVQPDLVTVAIENDRTDRRRLLGLEFDRASLRARRDAVSAEVGVVRAESVRLRSEFQEQVAVVADDLTHRLTEAQARLAALEASNNHRAVELAATQVLIADGIVAPIEVERLQASAAAAAAEVRAQAAAVARARVALSTASGAVLVEPSLQARKAQLDEIAIRVASLVPALAELDSRLAAVDDAVRAEKAEIERHGRGIARSTVRGRVWKRLVSTGQYVVAGTPLIEVVDEESIAIDAYFPQRYLHQVRVGAEAMVRPIGGSERLRATVTGITADELGTGPGGAPGRSAADDGTMLVRLSLDAADRRRVWVGQRVAVSLSSQSPVTRVLDGVLALVF
jgi:multidrug resistance efflux pump